MSCSRFTRRLLVVLAVLGSIVALAVSATAAGAAESKVQPRVVNGASVSPATFDARWRSIAFLTSRRETDTRRGQFCGAAFIAPRLVVTAAHCVSNPSGLIVLDDGGRYVRYNGMRSVDPRSMQVVGGRRTLSLRDGDRIDVEAIRIHPKYDPVLGGWDAALLQLTRAPRESAGVVPIPAVADGEDGIWGAGSGTTGTTAGGPWVAGWGLRDDPSDEGFFAGVQHGLTLRPSRPTRRPVFGPLAKTGARSAKSAANVLQEAVVPIRPDLRCDGGTAGGPDIGYGRGFDVESMLCAGTLDTSDANDENATSNGVDSCYGDSGGPLIAAAGSELRLVGIVSFGIACATSSSFGVYTRVAAMRSFLAGTTPRRNVQVARRAVVAGPTMAGATLRCVPGRWLGAGRVRVSVRWVRELTGDEAAMYTASEAWERLPGSGPSRSYRVRARDRGTKITCLEIATNGQTTAARSAKLVRIDGPAPVDPEADSDEDEEDGMEIGVG
jgi:V8-like Glu-specific endopeptidase